MEINLELLIIAPIIEIVDEEDYPELNEEVKNVKEPKETVSIIKTIEELIKGKNRKIINIRRVMDYES